MALARCAMGHSGGQIAADDVERSLRTLQRPPFVPFDEKRNFVRFRLGPEISVTLGAQAKRPGKRAGIMPVELTAVEEAGGDEQDAYARLLGDAMEGDHILFVRDDIVDGQWAAVEPILDNVTPVYEYEPGTWGRAKRTAWWRIWGGGATRSDWRGGRRRRFQAKHQSGEEPWSRFGFGMVDLIEMNIKDRNEERIP